MIVRRNVNRLSKVENERYVEGVKALKKRNDTYDSYVKMHLDSMARHAAHMGPAFLPWHREFLLRLERDIQDVLKQPDFALPYWDWAADAGLPDPTQGAVWATDFMGGNGNPAEEGNPVNTGPFAKNKQWPLAPFDENGRPIAPGDLVRDFAKIVRTLPTNEDVKAAVEITAYDSDPWNTASNASFRNTLEGFVNGPQLHNRVHLWVGGSMVPMISPNDPVFFLHHCNVDRIWAAWQSKNPGLYLPESGGPAGHNLNDPMFPFDSPPNEITPKKVLNYPALGYVFDRVVIESVQFPNVFLRMDGAGVTAPAAPGGGVVNCQFGVGPPPNSGMPFNVFDLVPLEGGTVAIESVRFPNVFLRLDGTGVPLSDAGGGFVNCQFGVGPFVPGEPFEKFNLLPREDGSVAIASVRFPGVVLRMDGTGVTENSTDGGGLVNCRVGVEPLPRFFLTPLM